MKISSEENVVHLYPDNDAEWQVMVRLFADWNLTHLTRSIPIIIVDRDSFIKDKYGDQYIELDLSVEQV